MKNPIRRNGSKNRDIRPITAIFSIVLMYLLISIYFTDHFFLNTEINGVNVSLKAPGEAEDTIRRHVKDYKLQLIERNGDMEEILGQDIGMGYNEQNSISNNCHMQKPLIWIISLLQNQVYYVDDLYIYNENRLENEINELTCLNNEAIEPQNVSFVYSNGLYEAAAEIYGNKIDESKLDEVIKTSIQKGKTKLDLDESLCYKNPEFTLQSEKTPITRDLLNKYVNTKITYMFGNVSETLDGSIINKWLSVDENLEVVIDKKAALEYVKGLSKKYDTVGATRRFKTSLGKTIDVKGGLYGWKINRTAEVDALIESIKQGEIVEKEPIYKQTALPRGEDEIGDTYVEINITRQHLWFYKDGKLITQSCVVTGDPEKGYSTAIGTYMLNYKQKEATLVGPGYETVVAYWMPFFGNMGIHDASWRYSFGGDIYKGYGSHGCVNLPLYTAKRIFDNIEPGTPIVCYEE